MDKPLVTIAIPTYNRADGYLKEALNSALGQTYQNIEVLISDNCSTDRTPDLIKEYTDSRLKYYRQEKNLGQRGNMNFLVEKAAGDYFLMLHDDDQIHPDFIETCIEAADYKKGLGLILTGSGVIDKNGKLLRTKENNAEGMSTEELILFWYRRKMHMFFCCSLFGLPALRQAGGFEEKYMHYDDVAAEFKCSASHGRVDVKQVKANLREHPGSTTSTTDLEMWCESSVALLDLARKLAPSKLQELNNIGVETSADRLYSFASKAGNFKEKVTAYWVVYKQFDFKVLPSVDYGNKLLPLFGYIIHPRSAISSLKKGT